MPNIPYSGGSYEKVLLFVLAVGISNVTALPTAHAADTDSGKAARTLRTTRESAGHTPVSALIHIIGALTAWPIHGGPEAVSVPMDHMWPVSTPMPFVGDAAISGLALLTAKVDIALSS